MTTPTADALVGLRDIHLPDPVPFWPPAPGWWIAAGLGIALLVATLLLARARRRSPRRAALRELSAIERRFQGRPDAARLAIELSALLRRVALVCFPAEAVAALHGAEWVGFLSRQGGKGGLPEDVGETLETALCMGPAFVAGAAEPDRWLANVRRWIRSNT